MVVYKYPITKINDWFTLDLPVGTAPIAFRAQQTFISYENHITRTHLFLWCLVDDTMADLVEYEFIACGTGIDINDLRWGKYIGTAELDTEVYHLFYNIPD